jgi:hypothetical protein
MSFRRSYFHTRQRGTSRLLRLPGRALAPPAHHQPDRIGLRAGACEDGRDEGTGLPAGGLGDDLQADGGGRGEVEEAHRISSGGIGKSRSEVRERSVSRRKRTGEGRRVTGKSNPQHLTIPLTLMTMIDGLILNRGRSSTS